MINLGDYVKDKITDLKGTAVCKAVWLNGCVRIAVQPKTLKDGSLIEFQWVDETQLEFVVRKPTPKRKPSGGPQSDPHRIIGPRF